MRSALIVIGVLGGGTAATFALAGAIFLANPNGTLVSGGSIAEPVPAKMMVRNGVGVAVPPQALPPIAVDDSTNPKLVAPVVKLPNLRLKVPTGQTTDVNDMTSGDLRNARESSASPSN